MKLILENWREFEHQLKIEEEFKQHQEDLREILRSNGWGEDLLLEFSLSGIGSSIASGVSSAWAAIKGKLQQAKDWTYEKYLSAVKPLINKIQEIIDWGRQRGLLGRHRARDEKHAFELLKTKKYIKLGYTFLSALVGTVLDQITELPEKIEIIKNFISAASSASWEDLCTMLSIPCEEIGELVGSLKTFGTDMKRTYGAQADRLDLRHPRSAPEEGWATLGRDEFEYAEQ